VRTQRDDPRLRGRPVVVGGGVVMAASYEGPRARRPLGHGRRAVVERVSIDVAFLDVAGLQLISGSGADRRDAAPHDPRGGRPADQRRRRDHEGRGQARERHGQAGRPSRRRAGHRARVPAPARGHPDLGRRIGDSSQAARRRHPDGRRSGARRRARAARCLVAPPAPPARRRAQPRRARGSQRSRSSIDRLSAGGRLARPCECASRTSPASRDRRPCIERPRQASPSSPPPQRCSWALHRVMRCVLGADYSLAAWLSPGGDDPTPERPRSSHE
jgi:hypothetical protein